MNNEITGNQFASRAVGAIFNMNDADLARLADELGIDMSVRELQFCRSYFNHAFHRAPLVAELLFIAEYLRARRASPLSLLPYNLSFTSPDTARAFTDMEKKASTLSPDQKNPPSLLRLMNTAGAYLKRAGHAPFKNDLLLANEADVALRSGKEKPRLILPLGDQLAALLPREEKSKMIAPMTVLAIHAEDPRLLPHLTAKIMESTVRFGALPLMHIGEEGFYSHLTELDGGIEIFATLSLDEQESNPYHALDDVLRNTTLFALPEKVVPSILGIGIPVKPIGRLLANEAFVFHFKAATVSLNGHFLRELNTLCSKHFHAEIPQKSPAVYQIEQTATGNELLCGAVCEGDAIPALLDLLLAAYKTGVSAKEVSVRATLACNKENLPHALSLAADLHRVTTELSLAALPTTITVSSKQAPTLTVALTAPLSKAASEAEITAFEAAVAQADYAALRALFYKMNAQKNNV